MLLLFVTIITAPTKSYIRLSKDCPEFQNLITLKYKRKLFFYLSIHTQLLTAFKASMSASFVALYPTKQHSNLVQVQQSMFMFCDILAVNTKMKINHFNYLHWFYLLTATCFDADCSGCAV
jgi:hypothetical protein